MLANDAFLELTGYLAEDLLGRNCRMLQGPDTSRTAVAEIRTIPRTRSTAGFGNVLLGAVLEKQLGGKITRDWREDGLKLRVELPSLDRVGGSLKAAP